MSKEIKFGTEARNRIKAGIDKAADAVRPTLGAVGMSALIESPGLDPLECDDGVTILKNLDFKDKYENLGLQKLRKAALRTSIEGGDGTATTTVLTQSLVNEAFNEISKDSSKIREVKERLEKGLDETINELSKIKREVEDDDIEKIAAISSLDGEVAKLISETIKDVGVNGVITVEKGAKLGYSKEVVNGTRFNKGLISPFFINDQETGSCILENPYIVLIDRKVSTNEQIIGLLNSIGTGKSILFIADDIESVALGTLAQNAVSRIANIACVRNPYSASAAQDFLFDMAALTGGTVISEQRGMKLNEMKEDVCGHAEKVIVTRDTTTIIGGNSDINLQLRISDIKNQIDLTTSEYEKKNLEDRLASLTGGIGVIRVGAYTDTEFNAKRYKFENAINATQAALQEGIVVGGGMALAKVADKVSDPMFKTALKAPFRQMVANAGGMEALGYPTQFKGNNGIDFVTKKNVDMFEAGIVDPFKVTRLAIESATAIAISLVGTETVIVTEEDDKGE
jgi:chaperonin GroEL